MRSKRCAVQKPVSPLKGSKAPCCGGGLSGICILIIHFNLHSNF